MIFVMAVLIHTVCVLVPNAELRVMVLSGVTVIVPVDVIIPHPPVKVTVYVNVPDTVGVPVMVTIFAAQLPLVPAGNPVTVAPVAPVVAYVIFVMAVLIHTVCASVPAAELRMMVLSGFTVMVPVVEIVPQPPVRLMV